ncbi:BREX-1 system adenine-specific DNA-methyltransferase PglX [Heyndrickxia oleronia]|jgi:type II restriction/modification system DNA methylase subunit YeeA|uniref:BREX-1 system adenine-specific DNA-methyltransferase PglX n=1 Tax=Heyndrickxia oleronia TaxID=38875 RepID=UPI00242F69E4|nr:BREX-1 system adenine-specific DNA-methyltransferase PglX [Heyndrickxia oleronia]MCI1592661.1 BREX-1 system adenine-specific DNA-methyltransferase PglX [Heyndrickxia oleronia]MCI1614428.1 BREX-1 system adenine-specific DNA-methyltransferase PglX [Heyndrickxia oleronia]MCI1745461.1 BREX-1 system adenine-specific DNA-methyltransferase PglX [Heyndrickxia oleronia]MCI1763784.1 BREX-1 system adenine-specific DNA-methyltransferase PglX [Heyndrickxia oleronia]
MNKSALKKFATEARKELLERVELQARKIGITAESIQKANVESSDAVFIDGKQLSDVERRQRNKLIARINEIGFNRVMEETAYTWFNRFIALRFMEVNDYLPTKVRVLSSSNGDSAEPDMMKEALSLDLELDKEYVYELKINNKTDELFKYLIKMHCNDLNRYMPFMFETLEDYKEILFPEGLLGTDSFVRQLTDTEEIPEDNWEKIEVIGWLYQYYIADEKDRVFKAKAKYKAEEIPYATQLFTPDWIVQYMVQNSLGRYWTEAHPEHEDLISNWEFFIKHQQEDFQESIAPYVNKEMNVEDIKCFDPAMGSGHILVYMFDVLFEIYSKCGYMEREIPRLIIEKNLYGLDIDDRAYQLACFSVVMKALQYNRRFLRSIERDGLTMNLASIQETNGWTDEAIAYISGEENGETFNSVKALFEQYTNAKTFGSLIKVTEKDTAFLKNRLKEIKENPVTDIFQEEKRQQTLGLLPLLINQTKIMGQQYDIVVMNPPYMGSGNMNKELSDFLRKNYPDSKADLFASFMEVDHYLKKNGFYAVINQHSWMFLSSFEKLREKVINTKFIDTMLHLGPRAFEEIGGEIVQTTAFVLRNQLMKNVKGIYLRLVDERSSMEKKGKAISAVRNPSDSHCYLYSQENYSKIPDSPIAYWASEKLQSIYVENTKLGKMANPRQGLATGNNDYFIREWFEVSFDKIGFNYDSLESARSSNYKWFPLNKGGGNRKWYGYNESILAFDQENYELLSKSGNKLPSRQYYFMEGITWSKISSSAFSVRYSAKGFIFSDAGMKIFVNEDLLPYLCSLLNSKLVNYFLEVLSETMNFEKGNIERIPVKLDVNENLKNKIEKNFWENIDIMKRDWDAYETSWEFGKHPLIAYRENQGLIEVAFSKWKEYTEDNFDLIKKNEEENNRIFIEIYNLEDELQPEVSDKEISVKKGDLERDFKSFISYAIGCSFGRYSLDKEGLIYAGGEFDASRYQTFPADEDNILPILPGAYFEDDIVTRFVDFVRVTFSKETLEENLDFIADAIGRKANETAREALRRYFLNDFYKDHVQVYKKRPIYWLFTSGKEKAFNCLIYMHRYDKTTLSRIRTDYLHEVQIRMDAEKKDLLDIIEGDFTAKEISNAKKELKALDKKIDELKAYDELLHHMADMQIEIDLDDGVKVNYEKFKGLVAKI